MQRILKILLFLSVVVLAKEALVERDIIVQKIKTYPYLLAYTDDKYKDDEKLVSMAIEKNGRILEYASKRLQNNDKLVYKAVSNNGGALAYASKRLKDDDDIVSMAIDSYGTYLQYASTRLQDDDDIVMDALRSNGANLEYASKRLRDDKWYVTLAIKNNSSALEYASKRLKNHKDLVLLSVATYSSNLSYASEKLQDNKPVVLKAVKEDGKALRYVSKRLKDDKEVVSLAIEKEKNNLAYASVRLQKKFGWNRNSIKIELKQKVEDLESIPLGIHSTLAIKGIKIKHQNKLIGYYEVSKAEPVNYFTSLNLSHELNNTGNIKIEIEEENGKKYQIEKTLTVTNPLKLKKYKSKNHALNSITEQKYKRHILKLRIKDELAYGAFMLMHPMLGEKEAKRLGLKADYIEHVLGKIANKIVFNFHCSAMLRADPFFRFTFNAPLKSGELEIIVIDNNQKERRFYKKYEI